MYPMLRPLLFKLEAERAHAFSLSALHYIPSRCFKQPLANPVAAMGLEFPHPIGLAAGMDKNGAHLHALNKLGFSFIEIGTVTPKPQVGNPKPRLFRLPQAQAIINRMGFNNHGVDVLVGNIKKANYSGILGINIGKNKDTPLDDAAKDYLYCLGKVYEYASYITINISSPNTPDLRQLQQGEYLSDLLSQLQTEQIHLSEKFQRHVPLLVKISPDESDETLKRMTEVMVRYGVQGIIVSNTTCSREAVENVPHAEEQGGLSGKPLRALSTQCLRLLKSYVGDAVTLIGVGGIDSCASAQEKLDAGATLLQVYTGLVYQGPGMVSELASGLRRCT
ncbi:MAG: quinone-dependent dihydroorotate dehydrogenase [Legionellales bacterium]